MRTMPSAIFTRAFFAFCSRLQKNGIHFFFVLVCCSASFFIRRFIRIVLEFAFNKWKQRREKKATGNNNAKGAAKWNCTNWYWSRLRHSLLWCVVAVGFFFRPQMKWINRHLLRVAGKLKTVFSLVFRSFFFIFHFFSARFFCRAVFKSNFYWEWKWLLLCIATFFFCLCHWLWFHYFVTEKKLPWASRVSIFLYRSRLIGHIGWLPDGRFVCPQTVIVCTFFRTAIGWLTRNKGHFT